MLLQFNVKNFMSIKNEIVFTAFANADNTHEENLIPCGKDRILPSLAFYGANAAGKTNIFKSLTQAIMLVRTSNNNQINTHTGFEPFLFDKVSGKAKTSMDFIFYRHGQKYKYGFSADANYIYDEYLFEYKSARPTLIFERTKINEYRFTAAYKNLEVYTKKNSGNKLFLSTATAWNCEATKEAYLWFAEDIDTYDQHVKDGNFLFSYLDKNKDNNRSKAFLLSMLKHADINIQNYELDSKTIENQGTIFPGLCLDKSIVGAIKQYQLTTTHQIVQEDGTINLYKMSFDHESSGTSALFTYGPVIMEALDKGKTIVIDELASSLHPAITRYLIELFADKEINKKGAQLFFNSQDVTLLDLDIFRRDQIYFVEKEYKTGITDLYSLADFSPRKTENIQKGYLQGRYGAIPFINGGIEW